MERRAAMKHLIDCIEDAEGVLLNLSISLREIRYQLMVINDYGNEENSMENCTCGCQPLPNEGKQTSSGHTH
jgi:hypothetical protein